MTTDFDPELDLPPGRTLEDDVPVRELRADDLEDMVRVDRDITGRDRRPYYEKRLQQALEDTSVRISLGAEVDGHVVGFVLGRLYYGEYGRPEGFAAVDTVAVSPAHARSGIATSLLAHLVRNLRALGVERVQTEVDWDQWDLLTFLHDKGFRPSRRVSLELPL